MLYLLIGLGLVIYFVPTIVAFSRNSPIKFYLFFCNLLLGETVIGWFIFLWLAFQDSPSTQNEPSLVSRPGAIWSGYKQFLKFSGRSTRSEFWWFQLWTWVAFPISLIAFKGPGLATWAVLFLIPALAVFSRRCHDVGRTGWWALTLLLPPVLPGIVALAFLTQSETKGLNKYGPDPLSSNVTTASPEEVTITDLHDATKYLSDIQQLLDKGTITQDEFNRMKSAIL